MSHNIIQGKTFRWVHFSEMEEKDFSYLSKEFKFHPLDLDDLRDDSELAKLDVYKYYFFTIISVPVFDVENNRVNKKNLAVFVGKNYVVTVTQRPIDSVERFFHRAKRSSGLKRDIFGKTTGYFLYKLLDYIFRAAKVTLRELIRETELVETQVYDKHTRVTTKRLGVLRRNVLFFRHTVEPLRFLIDQYKNLQRSYMPPTLDIYFDDIKDTLDGMSLMTENTKHIVDGLFDVNEAFLSHRMNEIIRYLTIISVVLMPPTLLTGYFGMNVQNLPFSEDILIVTTLIVSSLLLFVLVILAIDKRR